MVQLLGSCYHAWWLSLKISYCWRSFEILVKFFPFWGPFLYLAIFQQPVELQNTAASKFGVALGAWCNGAVKVDLSSSYAGQQSAAVVIVTQIFCLVMRTIFLAKWYILGRQESKVSKNFTNLVVNGTQHFCLLTKLIFLAIYDILGSFVFEHISATSWSTEDCRPKIWGSTRRLIQWCSQSWP